MDRVWFSLVAMVKGEGCGQFGVGGWLQGLLENCDLMLKLVNMGADCLPVQVVELANWSAIGRLPREGGGGRASGSSGTPAVAGRLAEV
jgi:hypothetical protein